jgi:hypothetical protein
MPVHWGGQIRLGMNALTVTAVGSSPNPRPPPRQRQNLDRPRLRVTAAPVAPEPLPGGCARRLSCRAPPPYLTGIMCGAAGCAAGCCVRGGGLLLARAAQGPAGRGGPPHGDARLLRGVHARRASGGCPCQPPSSALQAPRRRAFLPVVVCVAWGHGSKGDTSATAALMPPMARDEGAAARLACSLGRCPSHRLHALHLVEPEGGVHASFRHRKL